MIAVRMGIMPNGSSCASCYSDMSGKSGVKLGEAIYCWECLKEEDIANYVKNTGQKFQQKEERPFRLRYRNYGGGRFDVLAKVNVKTDTIISIFKCGCNNILLEKLVDGKHQCIGCNKLY